MTLSVVDDPTQEQLDDLASLYAESEYWGHRSRERYRQALGNSDAVVGLVEDGEFVAGARVLTDGTFYARVCDVHVRDERRHEGLGSRLLDAVLEHPALATVASVSLNCRAGLCAFYERAGFERVDTVDGPDGPEENFSMMLLRNGGGGEE